MRVRARMYVQQVAHNAGDTTQVTLNAVSRGKENQEWSAYTPNGSVTLTLTRKASAAGKFFADRVGQEVYVDFSAADDPLCTQCGEPMLRATGSTPVRGADGAYLPDEFVHNACLADAKTRLGLE